MRILLISHFFPPRRNAGTETYTLGLARTLIARGHDVRVLCAGNWDVGEAYWNGAATDTCQGVPVWRVDLNWSRATNPNRVLYDSPAAERWLDALLAESPPVLVHVTSAATLGLGVLRAPHRRGIPVVLTLMDFWFLCPRTSLTRGDGQLCTGKTTPQECRQCLLADSNLVRRVNRWVPSRIEAALWNAASSMGPLARARGLRGMAVDVGERKAAIAEALRWPTEIISHSRVVRDMMREAGVSARVRHLPNGHDLGWVRHYRAKTASEVVRFGYLGQITPIKGLHTLVEAFGRAGLRGRARLDIWGDVALEPGYVARLRAMIGSAGDIRLRGWYSRERLAQVLEDIDVVVVPSTWYENAPLVIQEAFAVGTPVIATDLGGMAEAVTPGVNGLLFERDSADDLARQLRRVVDDRVLLARLAGGVPPVRTIEDEVDELERLYAAAVSTRGA